MLSCSWITQDLHERCQNPSTLLYFIAPCSSWDNIFFPCLCIETCCQEEGRDDENLGDVTETFSGKSSVCCGTYSLNYSMNYFYKQKGQEAANLKIQASACMELWHEICVWRWGLQWKKNWAEWITIEFREYSKEEYCVKISCTRLSLNQLTGLKSHLNNEFLSQLVK